MRRFLAPGRANLIGEHTDHTDGLVLPVALDLGVTLNVTTGGDRISLTSEGSKGCVDIPADGSAPPGDGWGRFVTAVAAELAAVGRPPIGLRGHLRSDLPQGAGLSSSAALEVVVALALSAAADFTLEPLELAGLCRRAEHRAVGVPSGLMDQAASVLGRSGCGVLLDCGTLQHQLVPLPPDQALLIIDTGVRRKLESVGYGTRVEELRSALPLLQGRRPADVSPSEMDALLEDQPETVPGRRLRHVVTENARVRAAASAFESGDFEAIGDLFAQSHASLRDDFEVSIAELDALVELGIDAGATAARMTGGGFGGSVIMLAHHERAENVAQQVLVGYQARFRDVHPSTYICRAADGAREVS